MTGSAGFIGSHVVEGLLARGDDVVGLDNFDDYYDAGIKRQNLEEVSRSASTGSFVQIEGDIRDVNLLRRLFSEKRFRSIVHLAAMAGVRPSVKRPDVYYDVNVTGTLRLLERAASASADGDKPTFVLASTSSVYGNSSKTPFVETASCDRPLVPYSASKRAAEMLGYVFHNLHGLDVTVLRFFTVYGPRNRPDMMAYKLLTSITRGDLVPLFDGGRLYRDWTFVSDTARGILSATDARLGYEIINLGRGQMTLLVDFIRIAERLLGGRARLEVAPKPLGDVVRTEAAVEKAKRLLGYEPRVSIEEGVTELVDWFQREASSR